MSHWHCKYITLSYHTLCFHTFHFHSYLVFHCTFPFLIPTWVQSPNDKQNTDELLVIIFRVQNWWNVTQNPTLWDQYNMLALSRLHGDLCLISEEITLARVFHLKSRTAVRQRNEMLLFEIYHLKCRCISCLLKHVSIANLIFRWWRKSNWNTCLTAVIVGFYELISLLEEPRKTFLAERLYLVSNKSRSRANSSSCRTEGSTLSL